MNMNKKILILVIMLLFIVPAKSVSAAPITTSCGCELIDGMLNCDRNTCSESVLQNQLKNNCSGGELDTSSIYYTCRGYGDSFTDSSITKAYSKLDVSNPSGMVLVSATAESKGGQQNLGGFCESVDVLKAFRFLGFILFFAKILVPFIIIIMATFDYFKAVTSSKDDELTTQTKVLFRRIITGILIFFIPTLINLSLSLVSGWSDVKPEYINCSNCALDPLKCNV